MTREEVIICKMYLEDLDKHHTCNEYKLLMQLLEQEPCADAISREAVIDIIEDVCPIYGNDYRYILRERVNDLPPVTPAENPNKWIPVSERLPNFAGAYLVTRYFPNNVMNPTYLVDACFFDGTDTWHNDNRINHERKYLTNVVAWLEEPEPYKASPTGAEGEDKE